MAPGRGDGPTRRAALGTLAAGGAGALLAGCTRSTGTGNEPTASDTGTVAFRSAGPVTVDVYADAWGDVTVHECIYTPAREDEPVPVFDLSAQEEREQALRTVRTGRAWTPEAPFTVLNPYDTVLTGLLVGLDAETTGHLTARVSVAGTADWTADVANHATEPGTFLGQVIGLVAGARNDLVLTWQPDDGTAPVERRVRIDLPDSASDYATQLAVDAPAGQDALTPGLFVLTGVSGRSKNSWLWDNAGTLRAEVASGDFRHDNFLPQPDGTLVITTGVSQISVLDPLGRVTQVFALDGYELHHDICVVDGTIWVLATRTGADTVEDRILTVDMDSGEVAEAVDLRDLLGGYEELAHPREDAETKDWIHINSIDVVGDRVYLSGRETSTIVALSGTARPGDGAARTMAVEWLAGVPEIWEGTGHEDLFLTAVGDAGFAGQHTVRRLDDPTLPAGQYYLEMFDNAHWYLGTRDREDWQPHAPDLSSPDEDTGTSYVLRLLVDEQARTVEGVLRFPVEYSSIVSSVQRLPPDDPAAPVVVNSGKAKVFAEYSPDGELLAEYRYDASNLGYRVYKSTFEGVWFVTTAA